MQLWNVFVVHRCLLARASKSSTVRCRKNPFEHEAHFSSCSLVSGRPPLPPPRLISYGLKSPPPPPPPPLAPPPWYEALEQCVVRMCNRTIHTDSQPIAVFNELTN